MQSMLALEYKEMLQKMHLDVHTFQIQSALVIDECIAAKLLQQYLSLKTRFTEYVQVIRKPK